MIGLAARLATKAVPGAIVAVEVAARAARTLLMTLTGMGWVEIPQCSEH
jgi:hypothetical protein